MTTLTNDGAGGGGVDAAIIAPFSNLTEAALKNIRQIYDEVPATRETLDVLFAVDAAQTAPTETWIGFFVETACAQLVWDERPAGTVTPATAQWVLRKFDQAPTLATLALLVRLIEEAHKLPANFESDVRRRAALFSSLTATRPRKPVPYLRLVA